MFLHKFRLFFSILATNQEQDKVEVGDFLGIADPHIMKYFLDKDYFTSTVEYNYQALCPTEIVCVTDGASDLPRIFVVNFFHSIMSILQTLNQSLFALFSLVISNQVLVSESVSEYTKQVTEGLHRCTTKTEHWEWKTDAPNQIEDRIESSCQGINDNITCARRNFYSYKLSNLNALMIIADPPQLCQSCKPKPIFDGPLEGML